MEISGTVSLVTGASRGIGAATAVALAEAGSDVIVNYLKNEAKAQSVAESICAAGRRAVVIQADVADGRAVRTMVEKGVNELGHLDILFNNAGYGAPGKCEDVDEAVWQRALDTHLTGTFHCCRAAIPHLRKQSAGAIINMASVAGLGGFIGTIAYGVVKAGLIQFTRSLAWELGDDNIRVCSVSPGLIWTDFHEKMSPERLEYSIKHRIPLHRTGKPEEVAQLVVSLIRNDYVTGENVVIDGGLSMRLG
jgi:NAD(P)-dependent dehydrogenase (short-subunit alcohol dehydrogenase family)